MIAVTREVKEIRLSNSNSNNSLLSMHWVIYFNKGNYY